MVRRLCRWWHWCLEWIDWQYNRLWRSNQQRWRREWGHRFFIRKWTGRWGNCSNNQRWITKCLVRNLYPAFRFINWCKQNYVYYSMFIILERVKKSLTILQDSNFEELGFQTLFPTGQFGYTCERKVKLSAKKYFQKRLLDKIATLHQISSTFLLLSLLQNGKRSMPQSQ